MRKTIQWYLSNAEWIASVTGAAYQEWVATNYTDRKQKAEG
jgi:dTDP-glucose 4,6-dehydratase